MATRLRYEAWPHPGAGTFTVRVRDLSPIAAAGNRPKRPIGKGSVTLPAEHDAYTLTDIIDVDIAAPANDVLSLIRAYRPGDAEDSPIHEWLIEGPVGDLQDGSPVRLSGRNIEAILDYEHVEVWDWEGSTSFQSRFPDHVYGGRNILLNPGFEDVTGVSEVYLVQHDGTGGTFTLTPITTATSAQAFNETATNLEADIETALSTDGITLPDARVTVVAPTGTFTQAWRVEFVNPTDLASDMTGNGAGLTGDTLGLVIEKQTEGEELPTGWTKSQIVNRGTTQLHGRYASDGFRLNTGAEPVESGTRSLRVNGLSQFAGLQQVVNVQPGGIYQAGISVRTSSATDTFRLVIRTLDEQFIATSTWPGATVSAPNVWDSTTFTITDVQIPDGVTQVIFRFAYVGTGNPLPVFHDNAIFAEGLAPATIGGILIDLFDDAQTDHAPTRAALTFINLTFDAVNDTDGVAWVDSELSLRIKRGTSYFQMMRQFEKLGYEWNLTPTAATPGEWDLNVYNPGGLATDESGNAAVAIVVGQGTLAGSINRQPPQANFLMVEGEAGFTTRASNAANIGAVGRRARYLADTRFEDTATLSTFASERLSSFMAERLAPVVTILEPETRTAPEWNQPLQDYVPGTTITFVFADGATTVARRIEDISYQDTDNGLEWTVAAGAPLGAVSSSAASGGGGAAGTGTAAGGSINDELRALGVAVEAILEEFIGLGTPPTPSGNNPVGAGGVPTIFVAASDASDLSKSLANFQCSGAADQLVIREAIDVLVQQGSQGRLVFSEGTFTCDTSGTAASEPVLDFPTGLLVVGMGHDDGGLATWIDVNGAGFLANTGIPAVRFGAGVFTGTCTVRDLTISVIGDLPGDPDFGFSRAVQLDFAHMEDCFVTYTAGGSTTERYGLVFASEWGRAERVRVDASGSNTPGPVIAFISSPDNCILDSFIVDGLSGAGSAHGVFVQANTERIVIARGTITTQASGDGVHVEDGGMGGETSAHVSDIFVQTVCRAGLYIAGPNTDVRYNRIKHAADTSPAVIDNAMGNDAVMAGVISDSVTLNPRSHTFIADTAAGVVTVTLPDAADAQGAVIEGVRDGGSNLVFQRAGTDTFWDGATTKTATADHSSLRVASDGAVWRLLNIQGTVA